MRGNDLTIVGQDCHTLEDTEKIEDAYHNPMFDAFITGAIDGLNKALGQDGSLENLGCFLETSDFGLTHGYKLRAANPIRRKELFIEEGSCFDFFPSHKPRAEYMKGIFRAVGLRSQTWRAPDTKSCESHYMLGLK
jgi:hypothetical protein